ncbi:PKD domain-containing protein [Flavobacterium sp. PL12]|uniref:PKD domain-containing protein n=1 Tax=Flavobacterium sp. PL12 TaxID=3071718 RepID=UPI00319D9FDF
MKKLYSIVFLFVLLLSINSLSAKVSNASDENTGKDLDSLAVVLAVPSATITASATSVCQNGTSPVITFKGIGGMAPYTFNYTLNGSTETISTTTGNSIMVNVPTGAAGIFVYTLLSVRDSSLPISEINQTGSESVSVDAPPNIDFTFTNDNKCSGANVQFNSTISGSGSYIYSWDFGDGSPFSEEQNPSHSYNALGCNISTFNVTLTVKSGGCTIKKSYPINVLQKPDINFVDVVSPFDPFSNCSQASSNSMYSITVGNASSSICISSYSIDWGDGSTENNVTFPKQHTYNLIGAYQMIITAIGNNGCANSKTYIIKNVSNPLGGLNSPGSTQNLCAPTPNLQFSISNWGTNSPDTTYSIDYGDGTPLVVLSQRTLVTSEFFNALNPSISSNYPIPHIYQTSSCPAPSFQVKLDVKNACGTTPFTLGNISVLTKPKADFTAPVKGCSNTDILFTNTTVSGYGLACDQKSIFTWDFGDGTPVITTTFSSPQNITHKFLAAGIYTVTLTSQNFCGLEIKTQKICIEPALVPQFTINSKEGCAPLQVIATNDTNLTNQCSTPTYLWKVSYSSGFCGSVTVVIPDQTTIDANYNFTQPGTYSITLTTKNSCGFLTSSPQTVIVKKPPTVAINTITNFCQASTSTTINPTAIVKNCAPTSSTLTYAWSFPGGTPSTSSSATPSVSYNSSGDFTVSLSVTNDCDTTVATVKTFTIFPTPTIAGNLSACVGQNSSLSGSSTPATTSPWVSSNTAIATVNNSGVVIGVAAGNTIITYTNSNNCKVSASFTVNPAPVITGILNVCLGSTTTLTGSGTPATLNPWTSSSNTIATVDNAGIVTGVSVGTSAITYTNLDGCQKTATITVNAIPTVTVNSSVVCSGLPATVKATAGIAGAYTYVWTVPIGFANPGSVASFSTTVPGAYTVLIKSSATECESSSASGTVSANAIPNLVITDPPAICSPNSIDLKSASVTVGSDSGLTFSYWKNSSASLALSNANTITTTGAYYIKAQNANGCSVIMPVNVIINKTPVITAISNTVKCNNEIITAINFGSTDPGVTYSWTNDNPAIGLAASGTGNIASFTGVNTGTTPVIANITVTPNTITCQGASTSFTITVNPTPAIDQPLNQEVCNGVSTTAISFTGNVSGSTYNWTNNKPSTGLAASGTGDIPLFMARNVTAAPITATITVTPSINGCPGESKTFTITVNPSPAVTFSPVPQIICSETTTALVTLNSTTPGVTFAWTTTQPAGILQTIENSGTTTIPTQTLTNTTNADIIIVYNATASIAGGATCLGGLYTYTITVKPKPTIATPTAQTICSNSAFSITPVDDAGNIVPAGTVYTWSDAVISPLGAITGAIAQNTPQTSISQTLVNVTGQIATATYLVTPKSGNCNGTPFEVKITVNPSPKVAFSGLNQTLCSGSDSSIINLSTLTTGNVSFNWTAAIPEGINGATASGVNSIPVQTLSNSTPNPLTILYNAKATVNNGVLCEGPASTYSITVNPSIVTSSIISNFNGFNVSTVGASDAAINISVSGGSGTYSYLWSGPNGFTAVTQDISNVSAGDYTLTIDDGLCEPIALNFTLSEPKILIIEEDLASHSDVFCSGYLTGVIKVDIIQQSVAPYKYELIIQGGGVVQTNINTTLSTYTFSGLKAGIYDVKITDANGSFKTIQGISITEPAGIIASINSQTNILCYGDAIGSATVTASGGSGVLTYLWNTTPAQTTTTASGLGAGTYTVTITDANNCATTKQVIITEPTELVTSISTQTNILCFGNSTGSATLNASGGVGPYSFSWDTLPANNSATATGLIAGTYNVTVTDSNNCVKIQQIIISQPAAGLTSAISNSSDVSCFDGSDGNATVLVTNGTAPYTYSWNTVPMQTLATASGLTKGNYVVTVTDANGCTTNSSILIDEPSAILTSISAQINVACSGSSTGSATIVPQGGTAPYSYLWNTAPIQTSATGVNLAVGMYDVTVTDANNCSVVQQVTITEPNGIMTAIASQTNVNCFGASNGSVAVTVSGGTLPLSFLWDTANVNTTLNAAGLAAGIYNLTVTDANGCQKVQQVVITEPSDISITTNLEKDITCFGDSDGEIKITVNGGTPAYTFSWTKDGAAFSNLKDVSGLNPGVYEVTVSDSNNCGLKTAVYTITQPAVLKIQLLGQTNVLCFGAQTGSIDVDVSGGTVGAGGYSFRWTGPNNFASSDQNLVGVYAGNYQLLVTDNSGCTDNLAIIITQPTAVVVSVVTTPIVCYGNNDASINLTISGGVEPYSVSWNNLATGIYQDNLAAGDYTATIIDANNCVKIVTVTIPEAAVFKIDPIVTQISCFGANDGSIKLNLVGGKPTLKLVWSDGSLSGTIRNNLNTGTYTATIIDGTPCEIVRTFIIIEPQKLVLDANLTNALECNDANSGAINLLVSGGTPPFTYSWSNGSISEDLNTIPAGNYLVTVKDARNCTASASYVILRPAPIVVKVETVTNFDCVTKVVNQSFIAKTTGGIPPYQFIWSSGTVSGPNNEKMETSQNGLIILNAIDSRGCSATYNFNVAIPELGTPSFNSNSIAYKTYGFYSIEDPIQFFNTATGDYTNVSWDFGDGTFSNEENPIHNYKKEASYVVSQTVTYPFGCVYNSTVTLTIDKGYKLIPPTAFTPNDDGFNDYYAPEFLGLNEIQFAVYDTWGALIYSELGDNIRGWDGKINNKEAENGNYYYKISGKTFYGKMIKDQGAFVLIK